MLIAGFADLERERRLDRAWRLALRVALVVSGVGTAFAYALCTFLGADPVVVLALLATVGLSVGLSLPAARPAWFDRELLGR
jgi:hypothetical protein